MTIVFVYVDMETIFQRYPR